ncbi:hypothetical protein [Cellulomonas sp. URHB0016]
MDRYLVPGDVATVLAGAGYRVVGTAGPDGSGFVARPVDGSDGAIEVHVLATALDDVMRARVARLRALRHDHLSRLHDVVELSPGRVGLVVEHVVGPTLHELRAARAPLCDGEAVTVTIPVAGALAALHDAGLAHGAVDAATVVVQSDGRPVLTDLRAVIVGTGTREADVRRLLATVLGLMSGPDAHLAPSAAGGPTLRDSFEALLGEPDLLAAQVVDVCFRATDPEAVRMPDAGTQAAVDLLRAGHRGGSSEDGRRRERRRRHRVPAGVLATVVLAVLVAAAGLLLRDGWRPGDGATPATATTVRDVIHDRADPVAAAVALSARRADVVASADSAALRGVEVDGGPAFAADSRLLAGLAGAQAEGLTVHVADARLVDPPGPSTGVDAQVVVTTSMSAHTQVSADGATRAAVSAAPDRTVVLGLRWTDDGWRVWDVTAPG